MGWDPSRKTFCDSCEASAETNIQKVYSSCKEIKLMGDRFKHVQDATKYAIERMN